MPIRRAALPLFALIAAACSANAPRRAPDAAATADAPDPAPVAGSTRTVPSSVTGKSYVGAGGLVRLTYPAGLTPAHDFGGKSLMSAGWRLIWDGTPVGPGQGVVSFAQYARPADGQGYITELIRIGMSRDAGVVATCGTAGIKGGSTQRLPNRMIGGHRWTVWTNGDAGMSQQIAATDLRTVVDGVCYAIDRVSYSVKAADPLPNSAPTQAAAAARMDAILASVRVGGR